MSIEELVKRRADSDVADHTAYMESCIQGLLRVSICYIIVPLRDRSLQGGGGRLLRVSTCYIMVPLRDRSLQGGGTKKGEGGQVYPYKKRGGGGAVDKVLAMLKGWGLGGHKGLEVVLTWGTSVLAIYGLGGFHHVGS